MSTDDQPRASTPPMTPHGATRRRLTKAGLGAASVLWTLDSRAQMSPMKCMSPSAGVSGSLSSNYNQNLSCSGGKSPGYWKNHDGWPCPRDTRFDSVFNSRGRYQLTYGTKTLLEILQGADFDRQNNSVGKHLVATYLNVLSGQITFLSVNTLVDMWRQLESQGYYKPSATVFWTPEQTKNYLEGTYHSPDKDK
ncbi:hypothetical protein [Massilia consociata]|uniref:Uncharacterized protein n=1 Tax=Massilia consociata TaxID=760117 RepID=A0ABV6FBN5_9BURK